MRGGASLNVAPKKLLAIGMVCLPLYHSPRELTPSEVARLPHLRGSIRVFGEDQRYEAAVMNERSSVTFPRWPRGDTSSMPTIQESFA